MDLPSSEQLEREVSQLVKSLSDPTVRSNVSRLKELSHQHRVTEELLTLVRQLGSLEIERAEAATLLSGDDMELATMASEDINQLDQTKASIIARIETLLIPQDPRDERDVILEIRAGAGGEEAALFASELFRAYARYGELHGWKVHTVSVSHGEQGGYKEIVAEISGSRVFGTLKYERGVHRVQRVPETEKQGRIHTSTVTVAVLPQAEEVDLVIKPEDLRIDTYRSGGAGGQHVNKTSSAIRITHLPTNTVVAVQDERSQHKNKDKAMSILRARLLEAQEQARHQAEASERRLQVGTGDRSEKIRTYNYPQDRVTDHRIKESWSNIPGIMNGEWEPIFTKLAQVERELHLSQLNAR